MSDSDDDSLLGTESTFATKRRKTSERSRSNAMAYLDAQFEDNGRTHRRLERKEQRIKLESAEGDDFLIKAESLAKEAAASSRGSTRRREIHDEINGIEGDDDEDLDLERRAALATAKVTGRSTLLGVRVTLHTPQDSSSCLWHSQQDAILDLKSRLKQIEDEHGAKSEVRNFVTKPLRTALRRNMLRDFLRCKSLLSFARKCNLQTIPDSLCRWLFEVACSGDRGDMPSDFSKGAYDTLSRLLKEGIVSPEKIASVSDVVPRLEDWFGLCWKSPSGETENQKKPTVPKPLGLLHFLNLSAECLGLQWHGTDTSGAKESSIMCDTSISCLRGLERAGIDVMIHSGEGPLLALQSLICTVFNVAVSKLLHDKGELEKWMDKASDLILDQCPELGPGVPSTEDEDDEKACLCLSLMVRMFPVQSQEREIHNESVEFRSRLAMKALQHCFELGDWDAHLKSIMVENGNALVEKRTTQSPAWKAVSSAYAAFATIGLMGEKIIMDGPRCCAVVECAFFCTETGRYLYLTCVPPLESSSGLSSNKEEAEAFGHVLELLEEQCTQLIKGVKPMSTQAHYRRVAFHVTCLRAVLRDFQSRTRKKAGLNGSPNSVQQSIDGWLGAGNDSDDDSNN